MATPLIPFCGLPPIPAEIWQRWLLHPAVLLVLAALPLLALATAGRHWPVRERSCFLAGVLILALALVSPLCALSVALFTARASQHMVLLIVSAPLLAIGLPAAWRRSPTRAWWLGRRQRSGVAAVLPALVFATLLWGWHVPAIYDATFRSDLAYWAMHLSLLASALPLWIQLLSPGRTLVMGHVLAAFATFMQMGLLGALLTLAPSPLYTAHLTSTQAWGLTPLMDQQLGGLIMWVPGCAAFLLAILWTLKRTLSDRVRQPRPAG